MPSLGSLDEIAEFVAETGSESITTVPDVEGVIWDRFGISRHRSYVLINDDGTVSEQPYGSLRQDVADLLAR